MEVADILTLLRIILIPIFIIALVYVRAEAAAAVFALALLTDVLDGWLARKFRKVDKYGRIFDITVDKIFMIFVVFAVLIKFKIPLYYGLVVLLRDFSAFFASLFRKGLKIELFPSKKLRTLGIAVTAAQATFVFFILFNLPYMPLIFTTLILTLALLCLFFKELKTI